MSSQKTKPLVKKQNYLLSLGRKAKDKFKKASGSASQTTSGASTPGQQSQAPAAVAGPSAPSPGRATPRLAAWVRLETTLLALHKASEIVPPLHAATGALLSCLDKFEVDAKNHKGYDDLTSELEAIASFLAQHLQDPKSSRIAGAITRISELINKTIKAIAEKQDQSLSRGVAGVNEREDELVRDYRRIEGLFRRLQMEVGMSAWSIANDQLANTRLEGLSPAKMARFDSTLGEEIHRRTCTEHTREAILSGLNDWSDDPDAKQIYWMNGMAGTGKTTIACTVAQTLESRGQLGASFFCTRTSPECRDANRIFPTIAYQLARYSTPFQSALCDALDNDPDIGTRNIATQFERLLKGPLQKVKDKISGKLVVVIDALDECDNQGTVRLVLETLLRFTAGLPIKFFVASRPEPRVHDTMSQNEDSHAVLHLHDIETSIVQADIKLYLQEELKSLSDAQITQLVELSKNLFIYAATAVRYIQNDEANADPEERLATILDVDSDSKMKHRGINDLYSTVLAASLKNENLEVKEKERIRLVLWAAVCAREPMPIESLTMLAGTGNDKITRAALRPLRSVLHLSSSNLVSTFHTSFPDYIFDRERSGEYNCDKPIFSRSLTRRCYNTMTTQLRFNICHLESSFVLDERVQDLNERIAKNISASLAYACRYWADHLKSAKVSEELCAATKEFLSLRLLFWMEVMNLKHWMSDGVKALSAALKWLTGADGKQDLRKFISDAQVFVTRFVGASISLSTPHIYISALPLSSKSSELFAQYRQRMKGLIDVHGTMIERSELAPLATWEMTSTIHAAVFSPGGARIVSGSENGKICVWDATNGTPIVGPFRGHNDLVWSVALSPDGKRIVSGSRDDTIGVWDATNGMPVAGPFRDRTGTVFSVAFSPDGTRIVSGSGDYMIRVWDATDGTIIAGPFQGHTNTVWSVAYSPDGKRIVSGSADRTVRMWDAASGRPLAEPFQHASAVYSLAFSPDGKRIVSGSHDYTIQVLDATNGTIIAGPLQGHTHVILSVAFSPDGAHIVSGSKDCTIRLWDATNGALVAGPFQGHTSTIWSVAFSPDGTRIVSGSDDHTIRVWDATSKTAIAGPIQGHTDTIWSVAFSPNGTSIASGSADSMIRVWDATNGTSIANPFQGHTASVWSVVFSPNGNYIGSGSEDRTVRVWNTTNAMPISSPFRGHAGAVRSVAFSPDNTRIVSGSTDCTIRVWDVSNGAIVAGPFRGHTRDVLSVAFSPEGARIVSGSEDRTTRVWDATNGITIADPFQGHVGSVTSVAFSPDGTRVVSGSADSTIRVWKAANGAIVAGPFQGHTNVVSSVALSPDGVLIVSGSEDCTIRVWDAANGAPVAGPYQNHGSAIWSAALSADGTRAVSSLSDDTILVCNIEPPNLAPAAITGIWTTDNVGWFTNDNSELLFWIPPQLRDHFPMPRDSLVITQNGSKYVSYDNVLIGSRWHECFLGN